MAKLGSMESWLQTLLATLSLPEYGLSTVFVVSFISATLLPMGSEPRGSRVADTRDTTNTVLKPNSGRAKAARTDCIQISMRKV